MENGEINWAKIKAEYITSKISIRKIAEKYLISATAVGERSRKEKWAQLRKKQESKAAEKIADKLTDENVKKTVKEIDRVVKAAGKLITKLNRAVNELDKAETIVKCKTVTTVYEKDGADGKHTAEVEEKRNIERKRYKTLIDTKKAEQISKSLLNVKEILTDYNNKKDEDAQLGIIEIPAQVELVPPAIDNAEVNADEQQ